MDAWAVTLSRGFMVCLVEVDGVRWWTLHTCFSLNISTVNAFDLEVWWCIICRRCTSLFLLITWNTRLITVCDGASSWVILKLRASSFLILRTCSAISIVSIWLLLAATEILIDWSLCLPVGGWGMVLVFLTSRTSNWVTSSFRSTLLSLWRKRTTKLHARIERDLFCDLRLL